MADTRFREARWRRAGATDKQLADLAAAHAALTPAEQAAEAARVDSVSDGDLAIELADRHDLSADGTMDEVLAAVGDDAEKAAVALSHEQAKAKRRPRLITRLEEIIAAGTAQDG